MTRQNASELPTWIAESLIRLFTCLYAGGSRDFLSRPPHYRKTLPFAVSYHYHHATLQFPMHHV